MIGAHPRKGIPLPVVRKGQMSGFGVDQAMQRRSGDDDPNAYPRSDSNIYERIQYASIGDPVLLAKGGGIHVSVECDRGI